MTLYLVLGTDGPRQLPATNIRPQAPESAEQSGGESLFFHFLQLFSENPAKAKRDI